VPNRQAQPAAGPGGPRALPSRPPPATGPAADRAVNRAAGPATHQDATAPPGAQGREATATPGGEDRDTEDLAYRRLDAEVERVTADVAAGRLEFRRGVARIAMSAPGRPDLLDRLIETEARPRGARLDGSAPSGATLDLLSAARSVVAGEVALVGPSGVRVEQAPAHPHPVLRLRSRNGPVRECRSLDELARHVDLSALTVDRQIQ
jgi:hypothetical protein